MSSDKDLGKNKLYILTEDEFKDVFKLDKNYKIPKATLKQYSLYVKGSYLLYIELSKIKYNKPLAINFNGKKEMIVCDVTCNEGWQNFIDPLGNRMELECRYLDVLSDKSENITPFWTYTKFHDDAKTVASLAYNSLSEWLIKIRSFYIYKYSVDLKWRNQFIKYGDLHHPIWMDGCNFINKLIVKNPNEIYEFISDYDIKQSITNRYNVFNGDILEPVNKILNK